jgi:hypothetical protein
VTEEMARVIIEEGLGLHLPEEEKEIMEKILSFGTDIAGI